MKSNLSNFLDNKDRIKIWPAKIEKKIEVLKYLSTKFECGKIYTEKEVNSIIESWHTFNDYFLLRRGLIDYKLLFRTRNGAQYWREVQNSPDTIGQELKKPLMPS
jgi:hypothetical protein